MVTENQKFQSALFIKGIEHQKCYHLLTLKNVGNPYGPSIEKKKILWKSMVTTILQNIFCVQQRNSYRFGTN